MGVMSASSGAHFTLFTACLIPHSWGTRLNCSLLNCTEWCLENEQSPELHLDKRRVREWRAPDHCGVASTFVLSFDIMTILNIHTLMLDFKTRPTGHTGVFMSVATEQFYFPFYGLMLSFVCATLWTPNARNGTVTHNVPGVVSSLRGKKKTMDFFFFLSRWIFLRNIQSEVHFYGKGLSSAHFTFETTGLLGVN